MNNREPVTLKDIQQKMLQLLQNRCLHYLQYEMNASLLKDDIVPFSELMMDLSRGKTIYQFAEKYNVPVENIETLLIAMSFLF